MVDYTWEYAPTKPDHGKRRQIVKAGAVGVGIALITSIIKNPNFLITLAKTSVRFTGDVFCKRLASDLLHEIPPELHQIRQLPERLTHIQPSDEIKYPNRPPETISEFIQNNVDLETIKTDGTVSKETMPQIAKGLIDLWYEGILSVKDLSDNANPQEVINGLKTHYSALLNAVNLVSSKSIIEIADEFGFKPTLCTYSQASEIIIRYCSKNKIDFPLGIIARPDSKYKSPYKDWEDEGKTIACDLQQEAAIARQKAREEWKSLHGIELDVTELIPLAGLAMTTSRRKPPLPPYATSIPEQRNPGLSRRGFLRFGAAAAVAIPLTGIGITAIEPSLALDTLLHTVKSEISDDVWNTVYDRLPILTERPFRIPGSTTFLDRDGSEIGKIAHKNVIQVSYNEIPKPFIDALIATEDGGFWTHEAIDAVALLRAYKTGDGGASGITQQVVKWLCFDESEWVDTDDKSRETRKLSQMIMAVLFEHLLETELGSREAAKQKILELYVNLVNFGAGNHKDGSGVYGLGAASEYYFGKKTNELTPAESTALAGIPQLPNLFDPMIANIEVKREYVQNREQEGVLTQDQISYIRTLPENIQAFKTRQAIVLNLCVQKKYITESDRDNILHQNLNFVLEVPIKTTIPETLQPFCRYVDSTMQQRLPRGYRQTDLAVQTSLDLEMQRSINELLDKLTPSLSNQFGIKQCNVLVRDNKTGEILALTGNQPLIDHPPGSTVKVATYAAGLEKDIFDDGKIYDVEIRNLYVQRGGVIEEKPWTLTNIDEIPPQGIVPWENALAQSFNGAAAQTMMLQGVIPTLDMMERLGIYDDVTSLPALQEVGWATTLGTRDTNVLRLATMVSTIANDGQRINSSPIQQVVLPDGNVLYGQSQNPKGEQFLDPKIAQEIRTALGDNSYRPDGEAYPVWKPLLNKPDETPFWAKTGTSEETEAGKHVWTVGATDKYTIVVYANTDSGTGATGLKVAAPVFREVKKLIDG